jgi:lysophospholipase L1-like esterase
MRRRWAALAIVAAALARGPAARAQVVDADRVRANSYDDAWQDGWVAHLRAIHASAAGKTEGFVIHIGDSITYSSGYSQIAASNSGSNQGDRQTITWSLAGGKFGDGSPANKNGWQLARFDHPEGGRSYTASSGITTGQWLTGGSHGMAAGTGDKMPLDTLLANTSTMPYRAPDYYVGVVRDAQIAVVMLGSNDVGTSDATPAIKARLASIVEKLEAAKMMVVLSTIPPRRGNTRVEQLNPEIADLARTAKLPLIDFYAEILRRRPGTSWDGTLIGADGLHPTAGAYQDPDANGGQVLSSNGFLLRGWLTVQKLSEVRAAVFLSPPPDGGADAGVAAPARDTGVATAADVAPAARADAATAEPPRTTRPPEPDAASATTDAPAAHADAGGGCACAVPARVRPAAPLWLLGLALALGARRAGTRRSPRTARAHEREPGVPIGRPS